MPLSQPGDRPHGWVDSHTVSPPLLEFQFYGLAAEMICNFTNRPVILGRSRRPWVLPTPDRMEHIGLPESDRT